MNPLDQQKFDALINWHNEHTVMDKATEAEAIKKLNEFLAANAEAAAQLEARIAADDKWNFPDGIVIPLGNETCRILSYREVYGEDPPDDTEAKG